MNTAYEYEVQGNYGYGWDLLTTEATKAQALAQLQTYRENERGTALRLRRVKAGA
jgi:hypothetical protein